MIFEVDRVEGSTLVLIDERGQPLDIPLNELPASCRREGAVLRVPTDPSGNYVWGKASRDVDRESKLHAEASTILKRLKKKDPGGDVQL
jgi:hypothetical protein